MGEVALAACRRDAGAVGGDRIRGGPSLYRSAMFAALIFSTSSAVVTRVAYLEKQVEGLVEWRRKACHTDPRCTEQP